MKKKALLIISIVFFIFLLCFRLYDINKEVPKVENTYKKIDSIESFYKSDLLKDYQDIRKISSEYDIESAIKEGYFTLSNFGIYNKKLFDEFINKYNNLESSFIRIVSQTIEGDILIEDILFDSKKIYIITDYSRDKFSSNEDRKITFNTFEHIGKCDDIWSLYNGELDEYCSLRSDIKFLFNEGYDKTL